MLDYSAVKDKTKSFWARFKRPKYYIPLVLIILVILLVGRSILSKKDNTNLVTLVASPTTISQEVTATGNVKPADDVDLAFETSGKIAKINVKVGDQVKNGEVLASLNNVYEVAALSKEQAKMQQLLEGARSEDLAVSEAGVQNAETDLSNARDALIVSLNDAFSKADDAVRNHADKLYKDAETSPKFGATVVSGRITYTIYAQNSLQDFLLGSDRIAVQKVFDSWPSISEENDILSTADKVASDLKVVRTFLNDTSDVINGFNSSDSATNNVFSSFKTEISTARTNVNTAISNLDASVQLYNLKLSALNLAKREYNLKKAPATSLDIQIEQAALDQAKDNLSKTIITAPFDGVITKISVTVGEVATANTPAISLITNSKLQVEVNIPEADISKVKLGANASITFDAYGRYFIAYATVVSIDPAATIIDGVPAYRTTLEFDKFDEKIKSGMTANITIKGEEKTNIIAIPQRAVTNKDNGQFVDILVGKSTEERKVTTGLRGSNGDIEIVSGINLGDVVIISNLAK